MTTQRVQRIINRKRTLDENHRLEILKYLIEPPLDGSPKEVEEFG